MDENYSVKVVYELTPIVLFSELTIAKARGNKNPLTSIPIVVRRILRYLDLRCVPLRLRIGRQYMNPFADAL